MNTKKINNYKVVKPRLGKGDGTQTWKGKDLLDVRYFSIAILGKRRSGKSTLVFSLIRHFATKKDIVLFFSPTFYKDDTYEAIRKYLDKKGILWKGYTDIRNEDGVDYIDNFMRMNRENENKDENRQDEPENKLIEQPVQPVVNFGDEDELVNSFKPENPTKPEFILVFDDMSRYLREKSVIELLKNSRHFRCKIIMSTQSITDLHPHGHSQFDYIALFKNFNEDSLEKIYDRIEPNISFEKFKEIYHETTKKPEKGREFHNFLLIDRGNEKYRINLDKEIIIK